VEIIIAVVVEDVFKFLSWLSFYSFEAAVEEYFFTSLVHDGADELLVVDVAVRVLVAGQELLNLLITELLSERGEKMSQLRRRDESVSVLVEMPQALNKVLGGVGTAPAANGLEYWQKRFERDPLVRPVLVHGLFDLRLCWVLPQRPHHVPDEVDSDLPVPAVVVQKKSLLEVGDLVLGERGGAAAGHLVVICVSVGVAVVTNSSFCPLDLLALWTIPKTFPLSFVFPSCVELLNVEGRCAVIKRTRQEQESPLM